MAGSAMMGGVDGAGVMPMTGPMARLMAPERVDVRIAFLEAELQITEAQRPLWNAFADALRANARETGDRMAGMQGAAAAQPGAETLAQRLERREQMLALQLEAVRRLRSALEPLYRALDESQRRTADELLEPAPMGLL